MAGYPAKCRGVQRGGHSWGGCSTCRPVRQVEDLPHPPPLPFLVLPFSLPAGWDVPDPDHPAPWLLALLSVCVALPFFAVATSAPLLQKWFAATDHPAARDPYFLYAASNLGSMLALLGYLF